MVGSYATFSLLDIIPQIYKDSTLFGAYYYLMYDDLKAKVNHKDVISSMVGSHATSSLSYVILALIGECYGSSLISDAPRLSQVFMVSTS